MMRIPDKMLHKQNLVCLCVDDASDQEIQGRIFHGFCEEAIPFHNIIGILDGLENLFESIRYPQSTVHIRKFVGVHNYEKNNSAARVRSNEEIVEVRGALGTFLFTVDTRKNASWQGEVYWVEGETRYAFESEIALFSFVHSALDS